MSDYVKRIRLLTNLKNAKPQTLSERLRLLRAELDLTQDQLARYAGVKRKTVSHLETGRNKKLPATAMLKLSEKLGIAIKWLEGETDDPAAFINVPGDEQEILDMYRLLSDKGRRAVRSSMESMLEGVARKPSVYDPFPNVLKLVADKDGD